VPADSDNSKE